MFGSYPPLAFPTESNASTKTFPQSTLECTAIGLHCLPPIDVVPFTTMGTCGSCEWAAALENDVFARALERRVEASPLRHDATPFTRQDRLGMLFGRGLGLRRSHSKDPDVR
jgi:hypothetical protein